AQVHLYPPDRNRGLATRSRDCKPGSALIVLKLFAKRDRCRSAGSSYCTASSEVKKVLYEPLGLILMTPNVLPLPSVNTLAPDFNETHVPERTAPWVNAFKAFSSPFSRIPSERMKTRSGLQAR